MSVRRLSSLVVLSVSVALVSAACGSSGGGNTFGGDDGGGGGDDGGLFGDSNPSLGDANFMMGDSSDAAIDPDAFFANDPPPMWCGPDGGGTPPPPPGGTVECPSDKNRQGCPCTTEGQTAPCWPGLRKNRGIGICHDGMTTCSSAHETQKVWGPCVRYQLPQPGATKGRDACKCFSAGQWAIANLSPCFIDNGGGSGSAGAVSTWINGMTAQCPTNVTNPPMPEPGKTWSTDTLKVDCAGHFTLCYTLKAGTASSPQASDCVLTKQCVTGDYLTANAVQPFPDLPAWNSTNTTCAKQFAATGGYGEMSVKGLSVLCDAVDDGMGNELVFNRVQYCPLSCNTNPMGPGCANCMQGGSGSF
jgi:hypothetical protein